MKYKKVPNNENAIEIDGKVVLSFDPRYKEYLKWRDENPGLEKKLVEELEQEIENKRLYNNGASHKIGNVHKWYDKGGRLTIESEMKGDKWHGRVIQYNENEIVVSRENYIDGVLDGKYKYYHENGNLRQSGCIKNHRKEGEIISYWENGNLQSIETFHNGLREGDLKRYTENKKIIMSGQHTGNYKSGKWTWYYINGQKMKQELYKTLVGFPVPILKKSTNWFENGQKISEYEYENNLNSNYIIWYSNGVKKHDKNYKNNKLHGKWIEWHSNGIKRADGNMKYDVMDGKWTFWYHNGQKELECECDFGNLVGSAKIYHDNGMLKEETNIK
jgi:antitoxin component YwqK of YwqJK toxin-antitoxin module